MVIHRPNVNNLPQTFNLNMVVLYFISMGWCKKEVTLLLTRWSYVFLALTFRYASNNTGGGVIFRHQSVVFGDATSLVNMVKNRPFTRINGICISFRNTFPVRLNFCYNRVWSISSITTTPTTTVQLCNYTSASERNTDGKINSNSKIN